MIAISIIIGISIVVMIFIYNGLIAKKNEVENSQGGLDAQLKQRYDLIPNLVETAKEYMEHEKSTLEKIVQLRSEAINSKMDDHKKEEVNQQISQGLSGIMVQAEQYPELRSNTNFIQIQESLFNVEENIAAARRFYNSAVTDYNNALEMFPSNLMAKLMSLKRRAVFNIPEIERKNVNVKNLFS